MDQAFKGLVMKEYRMMRNFYITVFLVQFVYFIFLGWNAATLDELIVRYSLELAIGLIILPATVLFSLNMEVNQMEQFLHNPQSAHKKVLAKLFNATIISLLFFLVYFLVLIVLSMLGGQMISMMDFLNLFVWFVISVVSVSIFSVAILLLLWSLHQFLKPYIGWGWSAVCLFIIFYLFTWILGWSQRVGLYDRVIGWGEVTIPLTPTNQMPFFIGMENNAGELTFFVGFFIFYGVLTMCAYMVSIYLIERKVGV